MALSDDLASIPWEQLNHAYGSAKDTPGYLLGLLSAHEQERETALSKLWNTLCHQGTVDEASCAAIPFLIQVLEQVPAQRRQGLLWFLADLASREVYIDPDLRAKYPATVEWMAQAHILVGKGMPIYLQLLNEQDSETVVGALYLLSAFKEMDDVIVPAVKRLFERVSDDLVRSAALLCLSTLLDEPDPLWNRLVEASSEKSPLMCFVAAYALSKSHRVDLSQSALEVLVEAAVRPRLIEKQLHHLHWYTLYDYIYSNFGNAVSVHTLACEALARSSNLSGLCGLMRVLEQVQSHPHLLDIPRLVETLLDAAFFGGKVYERVWGFIAKKTAEEPLQQETGVKRHNEPFERPSYYYYTCQHYVDHDGLEIQVSYYDKDAAAQLSQRFEQEGVGWLSEGQLGALEAVLQCEPLWQVKQNLLKIYGLPESREHLAQLLHKG